MGLAAPAGRGASRPSTASRRMRDEQSTGGLGRARSRGAVEAANAGAFGLRRPRTTAIPHPHLFQETPFSMPLAGSTGPVSAGNSAGKRTGEPDMSGRRVDGPKEPVAGRIEGVGGLVVAQSRGDGVELREGRPGRQAGGGPVQRFQLLIAACGKSRAWTRRIEPRGLHCMAWRWARDRGRGRRRRCG